MSQTPAIRLVVGLGNPGPEYADTRHNAGFWWVDGAARQLGAPLGFDRNYKGLVARVNRPSGPLWLLQPQTFMNLSGQSVAPLARFFRITPAEVLVVHDELDLPPGQAKLKQGGGAAGHNGLKDITAQLGSPDYWRLRLGIGHPGDRAEVANWVLRKPPLDDRIAIERCIDGTLGALPKFLAGDLHGAMMAIHAKPPRPKPPRPPADAGGSGEAGGAGSPGDAGAPGRPGPGTVAAWLLMAVLMAGAGLPGQAQAATPGAAVYRCGNSYSQAPCPDGKAVSVDDSRSAAQQAQARDAARREAAEAERLRAERHATERAVAGQGPARIGPLAAATPASAASVPKSHKKKTRAATRPVVLLLPPEDPSPTLPQKRPPRAPDPGSRSSR